MKQLNQMNEVVVGRISEIQRGLFIILYENKEIKAKLKGSFYKKDSSLPVVGDYVTFRYNEYGDSVIEHICERKSLLKRPDQSGHAIGYVKTMKEQVMVANFDYVFIVVSLNENYNLNRIARYVAVTLQGNGIPIVILTKSDLCADAKKYQDEVCALSERVYVHIVSAKLGTGLDKINDYMKPDITIALLGSSGVGKSTLLNALAGKEVMKTGEIREKDDRGRHTTTYRQLFILPSGVTIIDTPGMRELGMCDIEDQIKETFSDIQELICKCHFHDCTHKNEPGCAVKAALSDGTLSEERWKLYKSLRSESQYSAKKKASHHRKK